MAQIYGRGSGWGSGSDPSLANAPIDLDMIWKTVEERKKLEAQAAKLKEDVRYHTLSTNAIAAQAGFQQDPTNPTQFVPTPGSVPVKTAQSYADIAKAAKPGFSTYLAALAGEPNAMAQVSTYNRAIKNAGAALQGGQSSGSGAQDEFLAMMQKAYPGMKISKVS